MGRFTTDYELYDPSGVVVLMPSWPVDYMASKPYLIHSMKTQIHSALSTASRAMSGALGLIEVMEKPRRGVLAACAIKREDLILVPNTLRVTAQGVSDPFGEGDVSVDIKYSKDFADLSDIRFVLSPQFSRYMPVPAWAVRTESTQASVNMVWTFMKVSSVGVATLPTKGSKPPASAVSTESSGAASETVINIPVLVNDKALPKFTELCWFRPILTGTKRKATTPVHLHKLMRSK